MSFNIFGKKKESEDLKQTQEIKNLSNPDSSNNNFINNNQPKNDFVNPFAKQRDNSTQPQNFSQPTFGANNNNNTNNQNNLYQGFEQNQNNNPFPPMQENSMPPQPDFSSQISQSQNQPSFQQQQPFHQNNFDYKQSPFPPQEDFSTPVQMPIENNNQFQQQTNQQPMQQNMTNSENMQMPMQQSQGNMDMEQIQEMIDETIEKIIDERWKKIVEKIEKVASWKEKQEAHINMIKEDIVTIRDSFEKLEKKLTDKISNYDKNIVDVNSEIKALEKVFQKITPTLVNNVNELSKIANKLQDQKKLETLNEED